MSADERAADDAGDDQPPEPKDKLERKHRQERQAEDERNRWDPTAHVAHPLSPGHELRR